METDVSIADQDNIGFFDEGSKIRFVHSKIVKQRKPEIEKFERLLAQLELAIERKKNLEEERKLKVLQSAKVVGMTITGAAIHRSLLKKLAPKVVIVEEAAEILEPALLASLSPATKHLILIGDHKQLRPSVETFELTKKCLFDVSMMERLISCGFPYKALKKQNRMRPEFSKLLLDIYPELEDNLQFVLKNKPLPFMDKSMFFWTHNFAEDKSGSNFQTRSKTNSKEADMVVGLAVFFQKLGIRSSDITILTPYLGQTKVLRQKLREAKENYKLFSELLISVQTIDMYQGDENEYVIVSLVRSCVDSIGFLDSINRRCVAQSRSKSGLYFVGNALTLAAKTKKDKSLDTVWKPLIEGMKEIGCVSSDLPIHCPDHETISRHIVRDGKAMSSLLDNIERFCKVRCGKTMPCKIAEHNCDKSCSPKHTHTSCERFVEEKFPGFSFVSCFALNVGFIELSEIIVCTVKLA